MRVSSLIILLVILGAIGYVALFQRDAVMSVFKQGGRLAKGYGPAKSPSEALEKFNQAIKNYEFETAGDLYCTGEYGKQLVRLHTAAREMGSTIDEILNYLKDKGMNSDKTVTILYYLHPFPGNFKPAGAPKTASGKTIGYFEQELNSQVQFEKIRNENLDGRLFGNVLAVPVIAAKGGIEIVEEGEGSKKGYKLNVPLTDQQYQLISYYQDHYKSYYTGLRNYRTQLTNDRIDSKAAAERDIFQVLHDAK